MKEKNLSTRSYIARDDDEDQPGDPLSIIMLIIARYKDYLSKTFDIICQKLLYSNQYKFNYINVVDVQLFIISREEVQGDPSDHHNFEI